MEDSVITSKIFSVILTSIPIEFSDSNFARWKRTSRRMPIVLGTFTSSSTKFVDLSYYAQSCRDSMKALQPLVAKNARRSSSICCRWRPNNERSTLLFSPFSSFVSQNREYAHISQWTFKSLYLFFHFALFCGNLVQTLNHRNWSLFKALVHSNLPLWRSWIINDVHSFCAMLISGVLTSLKFSLAEEVQRRCFAGRFVTKIFSTTKRCS